MGVANFSWRGRATPPLKDGGEELLPPFEYARASLLFMDMSNSIVPDPDLTLAELARIMYREYRLRLAALGVYVPADEWDKKEESAWYFAAKAAVWLLERRLRMRPKEAVPISSRSPGLPGNLRRGQ